MSAENFIRALENSIMSNNLKANFEPEVCEYENGITTCDDKELNMEFDGNIESSKVIFENGKVIYYIINFNDKEYVESGSTPDSCFISLTPGVINDYICGDEKIILSQSLSLPLSVLKSISYNDKKCNNAFE